MFRPTLTSPSRPLSPSQWIYDRKPTCLLVAETDSDLNSPFFLSRFKEAFLTLSATFDCSCATLSPSSLTRIVFEGVLAAQLVNCVACEGSQRAFRTERCDQWADRLARMGFVEAPLSGDTVEALRELTLRSDRRYRLAVRHGFARLSWDGTPLMFLAKWEV